MLRFRAIWAGRHRRSTTASQLCQRSPQWRPRAVCWPEYASRRSVRPGARESTFSGERDLARGVARGSCTSRIPTFSQVARKCRNHCRTPVRDGKLMAQQQVLEHQVLAWAHPGEHGREQQPKQCKHRLSIADRQPVRGFALLQPLLQGSSHSRCQAALKPAYAPRQAETLQPNCGSQTCHLALVHARPANLAWARSAAPSQCRTCVL